MGSGEIDYETEAAGRLIEAILCSKYDSIDDDIVIDKINAWVKWTSSCELFLGWTDVLKVFPLCSNDLNLFKYLLEENADCPCCYDCDNFITIKELMGWCDCESEAIYFYLSDLKNVGVQSFGVKLEDQIR